jgi:hypothetical protein
VFTNSHMTQFTLRYLTTNIQVITAPTVTRYASFGTEEYQSTNRFQASLQLTTPTAPNTHRNVLLP